MQFFYTTAPESGTITLPVELRGKPLKITIDAEPTKAPVQELSDNHTYSKKGILGLRGILKGYTAEELDNARYEYLTKKYIHD